MEDESNRSMSIFEDSIEEEVFFGPVTSAEKQARMRLLERLGSNTAEHGSPRSANSSIVAMSIGMMNNDFGADSDSLNQSGHKSPSKPDSEEFFSPPSSVRGFLSFQDSLDMSVELENSKLPEESNDKKLEACGNQIAQPDIRNNTESILYDSLEDICSLVSNVEKCSISENFSEEDVSENIESIFMNSFDDLKKVNSSRETRTKSMIVNHLNFDEDSLSAIDIKLFEDSLDDSNLSPYLKSRLSKGAKCTSSDLENGKIEFFGKDSSFVSIEKFENHKISSGKRNLFESVEVANDDMESSNIKAKENMQEISSSLSENLYFSDSLDEQKLALNIVPDLAKKMTKNILPEENSSLKNEKSRLSSSFSNTHNENYLLNTEKKSKMSQSMISGFDTPKNKNDIAQEESLIKKSTDPSSTHSEHIITIYRAETSDFVSDKTDIEVKDTKNYVAFDKEKVHDQFINNNDLSSLHNMPNQQENSVFEISNCEASQISLDYIDDNGLLICQPKVKQNENNLKSHIDREATEYIKSFDNLKDRKSHKNVLSKSISDIPVTGQFKTISNDESLISFDSPLIQSDVKESHNLGASDTLCFEQRATSVKTDSCLNFDCPFSPKASSIRNTDCLTSKYAIKDNFDVKESHGPGASVELSSDRRATSTKTESCINNDCPFSPKSSSMQNHDYVVSKSAIKNNFENVRNDIDVIDCKLDQGTKRNISQDRIKLKGSSPRVYSPKYSKNSDTADVIEKIKSISHIPKHKAGILSPDKSPIFIHDGLQKFHPFSGNSKSVNTPKLTDQVNFKLEDQSLLKALDLHDISASFHKEDSILQSGDSLMPLNLCMKEMNTVMKHNNILPKSECKENIPVVRKALFLPAPKVKRFNDVPPKSPAKKLKAVDKPTIANKQTLVKPTPTKIPIPQQKGISKPTIVTPKFQKQDSQSSATKLKSPMFLKPSVKPTSSIKKVKEPELVSSVKTPIEKKLFSPSEKSSKSKLPKSAQRITPNKHWNVSSPVSKYIRERPVAPLLQIVRPKEGNLCIPKKKVKPEQKLAEDFKPAAFDTYRPILPVVKYSRPDNTMSPVKDFAVPSTKSCLNSKSTTDNATTIAIHHVGPSHVLQNCDYLANEDSILDTSILLPNGQKLYSQHAVKCDTPLDTTVFEAVEVGYSNKLHSSKKK